MVEKVVTKKLNLGCGKDIKNGEGWINLDRIEAPGIDIVSNLELAQIPLEDSSIDEIYASHVLEHIRRLLPLGQELHRIAKPGALMTIRVPYGSSDDAFEDPTHVRQCFLGTFGYLSQPTYWKADYDYRGDWRHVVTKLCIGKGNDGVEMEAIMRAVMHDRNVVNEMIVVMECVKPIRKAEREIDNARVEIVFV